MPEQPSLPSVKQFPTDDANDFFFPGRRLPLCAMKWPRHIDEAVRKRKEQGELRVLLSRDDSWIDFWSNDYLGCGKKTLPYVNEPGGSTGSRLISGNHPTVEEVERELATFFGSESALLFPSGYIANLALFSTLPRSDDVVIYDEYVHASIRDGLRMNPVSALRFRHNDLDHLEARLQQNGGKCCWVVVESLYSMDGDFAPLREINAICEQYNALLIVDEAHSAGIYGPNGRGYCFDQSVEQTAPIRMIGLGKAYGLQGGILLLPGSLRPYFINFCRPFIYSTGISPALARIILLRILEVAEMNVQRSQLLARIRYFRELWGTTAAPGPIQPVLLPGNTLLRQKEQALLNEKYAVKAIYSPTVPRGTERFRMVLHAYNTESEIRSLARLLKSEE